MRENLNDLQNEIIQIISQYANIDYIKAALDVYHDYEIARAIPLMDDDELSKLQSALSIERLTEAIESLNPDVAFQTLKRFDKLSVMNIFKHIETDDLVDIIDEIEDEEEHLLYMSLIPVKKRRIIRSYLNFDEEMVGSIMNNNYVYVRDDMTVKQAIKKVVAMAPVVEYINNIYVLNQKDQLVGALSLKELMSEGYHKSILIRDIMVENMVYLYPTSKIEEAIELMKNYDFQLLPVMNTDGKLIGIISFDDTVEALSDESSADYASLAGLTDVDIAKNETVWQSLKKRLPWLFILLFVNLITSSIISGYEKELQTLTTLAIFMPLILNMAGNSSTQGLGVIIRLFAINHFRNKSMILKHLLRELLIGLINGLVISIGLFVMVLLFNLIKGEPMSTGLNFALVIGLSIQLALVVATLAGSLVPLFMNLIRVDPATASGPFITTINDILSLLIYFGLATALINGLS
jgi:magnesium transporter